MSIYTIFSIAVMYSIFKYLDKKIAHRIKLYATYIGVSIIGFIVLLKLIFVSSVIFGEGSHVTKIISSINGMFLAFFIISIFLFPIVIIKCLVTGNMYKKSKKNLKIKFD